KGPHLLEAAARGCGAGVASILIPAITGFDPIRARILQALGEPTEHPGELLRLHGILEFLMSPPGRIQRIDGLDEARRIDGVLAADIVFRVGEQIPAAENGAHRPGYLLAKGRSRDDVLRIAQEVTDLVRIQVEA